MPVWDDDVFRFLQPALAQMGQHRGRGRLYAEGGGSIVPVNREIKTEIHD
jgi:hypothetical protein